MIDTASDLVLHPRQGKAWNPDEDRRLYDAFVGGQPVNIIASTHGRSAGGIRSRLVRLGLIDQDGVTIEPAPAFLVIKRKEAAASRTSTDGTGDDAPSVFAIRTADGWVVDLRSNRPLSRSVVERLTAMLLAVAPADVP